MDEEIIKLKADHEFRKQMREADEKEKPKKTKRKTNQNNIRFRMVLTCFRRTKTSWPNNSTKSNHTFMINQDCGGSGTNKKKI